MHTLGKHRQPVRQALLADTRDLHAALHSSPMLACLLTSRMKVEDYTAALRAFACYFQVIEASRCALGQWPMFTLARECHALANDISMSVDAPNGPVFECRFSLLGGLYAAHGSALGRSRIFRIVRRAFPDRRHHFMSLRHNIDTWNILLQTLEEQGRDGSVMERIKRGSRTSFSIMRDLSYTD